jgi:arylsulfatase
MPFIDQWGTAATYNHYHAGWAWSGNTPFKYFKQVSLFYHTTRTVARQSP